MFEINREGDFSLAKKLIINHTDQKNVIAVISLQKYIKRRPPKAPLTQGVDK